MRGPEPPMRIGSRGLDRARGDRRRREAGRSGPRGSPARRRAAAGSAPTASSRRSSRSPKPAPKSSPNASCSRSNQPPPRPRMARPSLRWSSVVASLAVRPGLRKVLAPTRRPEPHARRELRPGGQRQPALELGVGPVALVGEEVVVGPERVEAGRLDPPCRVTKGRPGRAVDPEGGSESHRPSISGRTRSATARMADPTAATTR